MFACEHWGVAPDVLTSAKGLGSGLPIGAVIARRRIMEQWKRGAHGNTYGGNPVTCAAAIATIDLVRGGLADNAARVGAHFMQRLRELQRDFPCIGDVRGKGLMIGMELVGSDAARSPARKLCDDVVTRAYHNGLLLLTCGTSTVRFMPPLSVSVAEVDEAMALLRPLFCDEHLTYATEDGASGLLNGAVVADEGLASVYFQIKGTGWPWEWWNDKMLRLSPPGSPDRITMMPIRGATVVAYEKQMLSTRALTTDQVIRVRALDWAHPTLSEFRCGLFTNALPRIQADPPTLAAGAKNLDLFGPLLDRILTLQKGDFGIGGSGTPSAISLLSPTAGKFIAIADADEATLQALVDAVVAQQLGSATCAADGTGFCLTETDGFGGMIEKRFKDTEAAPRTALTSARNRLACEAKENYPNAPHIADLDCSAVTDPTAGDESTGGDSTGGDSTGGDTTGGDTTGAGVGDCCSAHDGPGCTDAGIEACVCEIDDLCCTNAWDDVCVQWASCFCPGCGNDASGVRRAFARTLGHSGARTTSGPAAERPSGRKGRPAPGHPVVACGDTAR